MVFGIRWSKVKFLTRTILVFCMIIGRITDKEA